MPVEVEQGSASVANPSEMRERGQNAVAALGRPRYRMYAIVNFLRYEASKLIVVSV